MEAAANLQTCTSIHSTKSVDLPLSQQLVSSEAAFEDAHHLLAGLGLHHHIRTVGLVQQIHEGLWRRGIHYG